VSRHGLFHVSGLFGLGHTECVFEVRTGWRCDVDGVHVAALDQPVGVVVPGSHAVPLCVVLGETGIAAHHGGERAPSSPLKTGPALDLGHVAATDDAPASRHPEPFAKTSREGGSAAAAYTDRIVPM